MAEAAEADVPLDDVENAGAEGAAANDAVSGKEAAETPPEVIDKATKLGWTPKDQFKGAPEKWVDPAEFVRRGEELMPILRAHNKKLERKVSELEGTLQKFSAYADKSEQRAYERAVKDLKAEMDVAVESGDRDAAADVAERMSDLKADMKAAPKPEAAKAQHDDVVEDWIEENPWFKTDRALHGAAKEIAQELADAGMTDPAKQLAEVAKRIKAEFPNKFPAATNPRRTAAAAVESAQGAGQRQTGNSYSDLPPDAKKICDEFVRDIKGFSREKYVKDWFAK